MPAAMTALATITLGSAASSVTFGSIPATYRDLRLIANFGTTATGVVTIIYPNSDTGNASAVYMLGTGSATASGTTANIEFGNTGSSAKSLTTMDVMDYSATDKHKTFLVRAGDAGSFTIAYANRWASTAAITSLQIYAPGSTLTAGSTFALYGILA
jgi:hypothetical protein